MYMLHMYSSSVLRSQRQVLSESCRKCNTRREPETDETHTLTSINRHYRTLRLPIASVATLVALPEHRPARGLAAGVAPAPAVRLVEIAALGPSSDTHDDDAADEKGRTAPLLRRR